MATDSRDNGFLLSRRDCTKFCLWMMLLVLSGRPCTPSAMAASTAPPGTASGVQLIMIEDRGCPYCARWNKEVEVAYAASAEGHFAPLVRRPRNHPDVKKFAKVIYSPTFIVVRDGVELGRIVGYPGADFFWGMLDQILTAAGFKSG